MATNQEAIFKILKHDNTIINPIIEAYNDNDSNKKNNAYLNK
ncbi:MAG: hypothetical protein RI955_680 [Bacteroidota bacterium]|jgi:hypothetical protein